MPALSVPVGALVAAALARYVLSFILYTPPLLGRRWIALIGMTPAEMQNKATMLRCMAIDFVAGFAVAYGLLLAVRLAGAESAAAGAGVGLACWLGFAALPSLSGGAWSARAFQLWLVNTAYPLLTFPVMGAVLAAWR